MNTAQIAGARDVPHGDGFAITGFPELTAQVVLVVTVTKFVRRLGDPSPEFGEIDHNK